MAYSTAKHVTPQVVKVKHKSNLSLFRPMSVFVRASFCITPPPTLINLHILPLVIVHTAPGWWTSGEDQCSLRVIFMSYTIIIILEVAVGHSTPDSISYPLLIMN